MRPSVQMVLIYLASLLTLFFREAHQLNEETQPSTVRSAVHTQFSMMPRRGRGGSDLTPTSSVMDGASLALTGTMLKNTAVCVPSSVAFQEHSLHSLLCPSASPLVWMFLEFLENVSTRSSFWVLQTQVTRTSVHPCWSFPFISFLLYE